MVQEYGRNLTCFLNNLRPRALRFVIGTPIRHLCTASAACHCLRISLWITGLAKYSIDMPNVFCYILATMPLW